MKDINKAGLVIIVLHVVGTVGMLLPQWVPLMKALTPANLLIVTGLVMASQERKTSAFYLYALLCFTIAFFSEVVGVKTGWPFGSYEYGATLGIKWLEVPLIIGANWLVLVLCSASMVRFIENKWLASLAGALVMLGLDYLLEPVAVRADYWTWHAQAIPVQNYVSWLALAFILHRGLHFFPFSKRNDVAWYVVGAQAGFFLILNLFG